MKAAQPLDKGSSNPHGPGKKQKPEKPVVVPLPVTEVANLQTQKPESTTAAAGSANPSSNRTSLKVTIAPVHGSRTIYDKGAEIRYGKFQESLAETGDLNHPDTQKLEKSYISTLSISQIQDYQNLKNGTYLPKTLEEQAAAYQENKIQKEAQQKAKPAGSGNADDALTELSHAPATELAAHFNTIQDSSAGLFNTKAERAAHGLPKVNAKSGSAFTGSKLKRKASPAKKTAKPGKKTIQPVAQKPKPKEISFTQSEPLKKTNYSFNTSGKTGGLEKQAQNQLDHIQLDTSAIPAAMQQDTRVYLTGEADTQHLSVEQQEAAHDMSTQKDYAENDIHKDYGENDIIKKPKDEILKPSRKISAKAIKKQPLETLKLEGIDKAGINAQFAPAIRTKIGTENEKYKAAELEHDQKVLEQEKTAETQIGAEKDRSHEKQLKTVKDARSDVHSSRVEWQQALDKTETDFAKKSGDHTKATLGNIKTEKTRGETTAQQHVDKANEEARKKKEAAQTEARQKKAEQQKASGGFFGWVADKASAFINALKDALNYIFTKLRDAVKVIFEAAKTLVLAALELSRKAIVSLIKAFASVIKGFLDIALAAFPGIRDRLKARIDKYVAVAEKLVNQAFEAFKKAVVAVIDFLAEVVDNLLASLQAVYNLILDAVNFIVAGMIKILEFIFNLTIAAGMSVLEFFGALAEEALGGDPAKPLQDVEVPLGQERAWASAMGMETESKVDQEGKSSVNDAIPVLTKSKLDDDDVILEPYPAVSVDKDFMKSLPDLKDGDKLELGGAGANSVTTKQFQESAAFDAGYGIHNEEESAEQASDVAEAAGQNQKDSGPDWRHMSDEEKLKQYNDQMLVQSAKEGDAEPTSQKAAPEATEDHSPEALITKTGRLNAGRRLQFMGEQMLTGIKVFWNKYKAWIIGGFVAALVAVAAILIFSGGAALGAVVSALGEALTLIFGAVAVYRAMGMLWEYVKKAWAGDKEGAAKSLAIAFAIIVVEFFIDKIMAGMGKVYKRMLKVFKSTKFGRAVRTGLAFLKRTQRRTRDLLRKGVATLRGTRVAIYLEKIAVKGAGKLDDLRNKILTKFGFKKIWLEKRGKLIQLWGEFNPKVLLMEEGEITSRDLTEEELLEIKNRRLDNKVIGEKLDNGGIVVSDSFAKGFMEGKSSKTLDDLQNMDAEDIRKLSGNAEGTKELRRGIEGLQPKNFQAHHVIPRELEKTFSKFFSDIGFNIENGKINGIMVPPSDEVLRVAKLDIDIPIGNKFDDYARHLGSHPDYTEQIAKKIAELNELYLKIPNPTSQQKEFFLNQVIVITNKSKFAISKGKGKTVNSLILNL